jgi:hypothetical protein
MDRLMLIALILAFVWGGVWAAFLQFTVAGQFLAKRRTWITVVVGVGGDMLIALLCISFGDWARMGMIIALSAVAIIVRSLFNEWYETNEIIRAFKNKDRQQDDLGA